VLSTKWLGGLLRRSVQQDEAPARGVEAIITGNSFALWQVCRSRTRRSSSPIKIYAIHEESIRGGAQTRGAAGLLNRLLYQAD
jgi:hypothetical protein